MTIGMNHGGQLALDHFFGAAGLALIQSLANANDGCDAGGQRGLGLVGHQGVGFTVILTALGMAHDHITASQILEHRGTDFAGVGTRRMRRYILRTEFEDSEVGVSGFQGMNLRQVRSRHTHDDFACRRHCKPLGQCR